LLRPAQARHGTAQPRFVRNKPAPVWRILARSRDSLRRLHGSLLRQAHACFATYKPALSCGKLVSHWASLPRVGVILFHPAQAWSSRRKPARTRTSFCCAETSLIPAMESCASSASLVSRRRRLQSTRLTIPWAGS